MKRNFIIFGMMLVLGLSFFGCKNDPPDVWSNVTGFDQLNGTWKGSFSKTTSMNEGILLINAEMIITGYSSITFNTTAKTQQTSLTVIVKFSGPESDILYYILVAAAVSDPSLGFTIDYGNKTVTMTFDEPPKSMTELEISMLIASMEINQYGTKIRIPADEGDPDNEYDDRPEMILFKQ